VITVLASLGSMPASAQGPGDLVLVPASRSIQGSEVTSSGVFIPGGTTVVCFTASNASPDLEYITSVVLDFPTGWTVACSSQDAQDSSGYNVTLQCGATGNQVTYDNGNLVEGTWGFCVSVTALAGAPVPSPIQWSLDGDGLGDPPHSLSGQISMLPVELQTFSIE
jgi:hypothetical protein